MSQELVPVWLTRGDCMNLSALVTQQWCRGEEDDDTSVETPYPYAILAALTGAIHPERVSGPVLTLGPQPEDDDQPSQAPLLISREDAIWSAEHLDHFVMTEGTKEQWAIKQAFRKFEKAWPQEVWMRVWLDSLPTQDGLIVIPRGVEG